MIPHIHTLFEFISIPYENQHQTLNIKKIDRGQIRFREYWITLLQPSIEFRSAVSEEKSKMSQPIRGQGGHLVFRIGTKNTNLVEDVEILLPVKFRWIPFSGLRGEVENVSVNQRPGWPSFFRSTRKTQTWKRTLTSCFLSSFVEFRSAVSVEKSKMSQPIRVQGGHLVFFYRSAPQKTTNLVVHIEILLPVKFHWIPFSGFRWEIENVSANQTSGRPSCFSVRLEKHKLGRRCWVLASCQVSLNFVQWFQRRSRKCGERRTDDGQRVITIVHLSLRLRCTKNTAIL